MLLQPPSLKAVASAAALCAFAAMPAAVAAQTRPALTRDVDRPTGQPVNGACSAVPLAAFALAKCVLFTVPAGKRLVVELISYRLAVDAGQSLYYVIAGRNDPRSANLLLGNPQVYALNTVPGVILGGLKRHTGSHSMTFYLESGEELAAEVDYTGGANYNQDFAFSGYLVDK